MYQRMVTESELVAFQKCPMHLVQCRQNNCIVDPEEHWPPMYRIIVELLRGTLGMWLRRGSPPTLKRTRRKWDMMATKHCVEQKLSPVETSEFLIKGSSILTNICLDIEDKGYMISLAKRPVRINFSGVTLTTEPDAVCANPDGSIVMINFGIENDARSIINNYIYRARLMALTKALRNEEVFFAHYGFGGKRWQYTSRSLCDDKFYENLAQTTWAISSRYNVPSTQMVCTEHTCDYYGECFL